MVDIVRREGVWQMQMENGEGAKVMKRRNGLGYISLPSVCSSFYLLPLEEICMCPVRWILPQGNARNVWTDPVRATSVAIDRRGGLV